MSPRGRSRDQHWNWKGWRYLCNGYVYIHLPEHPRATKDGYVLEHVLVAEKKVGRAILPHEVVHHRNKQRADNRPENLDVLTRQQHQQHHNGLNGRPSQRKKRYCIDCSVKLLSRHLKVIRCRSCSAKHRHIEFRTCKFDGCKATFQGRISSFCEKHRKLLWWRRRYAKLEEYSGLR